MPLDSAKTRRGEYSSGQDFLEELPLLTREFILNRPRVHAFLRDVLGGRFSCDIADDILQNVLVRLLKAFTEGRKVDDINITYLAKALKNEARVLLRQNDRFIHLEDLPPIVDEGQKGPAMDVSFSETFSVIRQAIEEVLTPDQKRIIFLMFERDMSVREIAQELDLNENTARKRLGEIRRILREKIRGMENV